MTGGADGTVRTYGCEICGGVDDLLALAESRLAGTRRELTQDEREHYLRLIAPATAARSRRAGGARRRTAPASER